MKVVLILAALLWRLSVTQGFSPGFNNFRPNHGRLQAKYNTMEEILAKFPDDKPVLINFYDAETEAEIKEDIFRAKDLLKDRATLVSIKQQDYPELAKLWDASEKSPAMIMFKDGRPVARLFEETHYLEIVTKFAQYCSS